MDVPASKTFAQASVRSRKRIAEDEHATRSLLFEFKAERSVNIPRIFQQARRVELGNRRVHHDIGGVALLVGVEPTQSHAPTEAEVDSGSGQPGDELLWFGDGRPDSFDGMREMTLKAQDMRTA